MKRSGHTDITSTKCLSIIGPDNPLGASYFFTKQTDGLAQSWDFARSVYINPPYNRGSQSGFQKYMPASDQILIKELSCYCPLGQIHSGSISIFTNNQMCKLGFYQEG
jgi:WD40 repeat protein